MSLEVFDSMEAALAEIKAFQLRTSTRFISIWASKKFGLVEDLTIQNHKVHFYKSPQSKDTESIPYIIMGNRWMACHRGKQLRLKRMESRPRKRPIKYSHKIGCSAGIIMRDIMTFPDFKIKCDSKHFRREGSKVLRSAILEDKAEGVRKIIAQFPDSSEHCEECKTKVAGVAACVDERVVRQIQIFKMLGVEKVSEMQKKLREFVRKELYAGTKPPAPSDRQFFPTLVDIRNAMLVPTDTDCLQNGQGIHTDQPLSIVPDHPLGIHLDHPPTESHVTERAETVAVTDGTHPTHPTDHQYGDRLDPKEKTACMYVTNEGVVAQVIIEEMVQAMDTQVASEQIVETSEPVSDVYHGGTGSHEIIPEAGTETYHLSTPLNNPACQEQPGQLSAQIPHGPSHTYHNPESSLTYQILGPSSQLAPQTDHVPTHCNALPSQHYHLPPQSNPISQQSYNLTMQHTSVPCPNYQQLPLQSYPMSTLDYQVSSQSTQQPAQPYSAALPSHQQFMQSRPVVSMGDQVSLLGHQGSGGRMSSATASSISTHVSSITSQASSGMVHSNIVSPIMPCPMSSIGNQVSTDGNQISSQRLSGDTDQISIEVFDVSMGDNLVPIRSNQVSARPSEGPNQPLSAVNQISTGSSESPNQLVSAVNQVTTGSNVGPTQLLLPVATILPESNPTSSKRTQAVRDLNPIAASCIERLQELTSLTQKVQDNEVLRVMLDNLESFVEELTESLLPKRKSTRRMKKRPGPRTNGKTLKRKASVKGESNSPQKKSNSTMGPMKTTARLMTAGQLVITHQDAQPAMEEVVEVVVKFEPKRASLQRSPKGKLRRSARFRPTANVAMLDDTAVSETLPSARERTETENRDFNSGKEASDRNLQELESADDQAAPDQHEGVPSVDTLTTTTTGLGPLTQSVVGQ